MKNKTPNKTTAIIQPKALGRWTAALNCRFGWGRGEGGGGGCCSLGQRTTCSDKLNLPAKVPQSS